MNVMKYICGIITAVALVAGSVTPVAAQEMTVSPQEAAMTEAFTAQLGMTEVIPNFYLDQQQMRELKQTQCTGGPRGLFNEYRQRLEDKGRVWCGRKANADLDRYFKEGAIGYLLMAGPTGLRLTIYDQAINLNRNVKCIANIPYSGVFTLQFSCVDSQSGKQITSQIIGQILGNAIPMVATTMVSNFTAPRAGNTSINVTGETQSGAASVAGAVSEGSPVTVNNINQNANQNGYVPCEGTVCF